MAGPGFTRDEVILALDVLYSSPNGKVKAEDAAIQDLSLLLNRLPIHPKENRRADFRNATGVARQLMHFRSSCSTGNRSLHVGVPFFNIAFEYENRADELHAIATAIRAQEGVFVSLFGAPQEDIGFPEGILLGHLHRIIEQRDGGKPSELDHCEVCQLKPSLCYRDAGELLQNHLLVPPTSMDYAKKYKADRFLTVCPTCHAALHRYRPWLTKENCGELLR